MKSVVISREISTKKKLTAPFKTVLLSTVGSINRRICLKKVARIVLQAYRGARVNANGMALSVLREITS